MESVAAVRGIIRLRELIHQRVCGSRTCKPNSVCRISPAGRSFLWATHCCGAQATYPEVVTHRAGTCLEPKSQTPSLFGLAPCGVCPARCITAAAVRSYRTFSPLPRRCRRGGMFSVALSVEWFSTLAQKTRKNGPPPPGRYPAHCSAEFGLSSPCARRRRERPSGPAANLLIICDLT